MRLRDHPGHTGSAWQPGDLTFALPVSRAPVLSLNPQTVTNWMFSPSSPPIPPFKGQRNFVI